MIGDLVATLTVNSQKWSAGLKKAQAELSTFSSSVSSQIASVVAGFAGVGAIGKSVQLAASFEQTTVAMETMLGSGAAAKTMLADLEAFALKTPFEFTDLADATKRMMALGYSSEQVIPTLRIVGDAVSALGSGKEGLDRVILALGQMQAKGRVQSQEMNQLAEAGIPAWQSLAKAIGVDVPTAMAMVEARAVSSTKGVEAILAGMQERFGGGMERQSKTLAGTWSNLKDAIGFAMRDIGDSIAKGANLKGLIEQVGAAVKAWRPLAMVIGQVIGFFGRMPRTILAAVSALMAVVAAQRAIAAAQVLVLSLSGPKGWAALAAGVAIAVAALRDVQAQFDLVTTSAQQATAAAAGVGSKKATAADGVLTSTDDAQEVAAQLADFQQRIAQIRDALEAQPFLRNALLDPILKSVDAASFFKQKTDANVVAAAALNQALLDVAATADIIGKDRADAMTAAITRQIGEVTGVTKAIAEARLEAAKLNGTYDAIAETLNKFASAGVTGGQFAELKDALRAVGEAKIAAEFDKIRNAITDMANGVEGFGDKLREMQKNGATQSVLDDFAKLQRQLSDMQAAKSLEESLVTPAEKLQRELSKIRDLEAKGLITTETARRATEKAKGDFNASEGKDASGTQTLGALAKGSREAYSAIAKAMASTRNTKLENLAEKQLEEQKKTNAALERASGAGGGGKDVVIYGGAI